MGQALMGVFFQVSGALSCWAACESEVSYQKLLKYYVLNALKHRPRKPKEEVVPWGRCSAFFCSRDDQVAPPLLIPNPR